MEVPKIYNFTNIASHYRSLLWEKLIEEKDFEYHFFFGKNKSLKIKQINFDTDFYIKNKSRLHPLTNYWIKGKVLLWQSGVISNCLTQKIHTAIFLGEFQVLSTWIAMLICRIRGVKVVYWTHGLYGNESFWKKKIRVLFYKTANKLLLYERRAKKILIEQGIKTEKLIVIYNSLDYDIHKKLRNKAEVKKEISIPFFKNNKLPYLIFVGRLTQVKKIDLLIQAVCNLNKTEQKVNLLIVGDGAEKESLIELVNKNESQGNINFYGECYDEIILASFIYNASLCVSPGNVGLTAVHSLSFGTPVCTHNNPYNQMPEFEVIDEGESGCFFEENNLKSLEESISNWINKNYHLREEIRENCYEPIDLLYNPYNQVTIIKQLIC